MQTEQSNICVIAKPRNNSDEWKIDGCSLSHTDKPESFVFDIVVQSTADHASFYRETTQDRVSQFLHGCNVTVVAYGAANSGKTHTIIGTAGQTRLKPEARGVIVRAATQLFDHVYSPDSSDKIFYITASFFHVFDDGRVADLLDTQKRNVKINSELSEDDCDEGTIFTADVSRHTVSCVEDVVSLVERGSLMRNASGCIRNKQQPSLLKKQLPLTQLYKEHVSHAFFCLNVEQKRSQNSDDVAIVSQLQIVDLAGHNIDKYHNGCCEDAGINTLHELMSMDLTTVQVSSPSLCKLLAQSFGGNNLTVFICNVQLDNSDLTLKCLNTVQMMVNKIVNNAVIFKVPVGKCKISNFISEANVLKESVAKKCGINDNITLWKYSDDGQLNINGISVADLSGSCQSIVQKIKEIETQLVQGGTASKKLNQNVAMQFPPRVPLLPVKSRSPLLPTPASLRPLPLPLKVANKPAHNQVKKIDHLSVTGTNTSCDKATSLTNAVSTESVAESDTESEEELAPALPPAGILPALAGIPHVLPEPSVQPQPVPLLPTASATVATALTPPIIHVQPQTSELAYDTSSLQGFASSSPIPGDIDSIKTPSLSNSEDDDSVAITPRTKSPSPPVVPSPTSFEIPSVSPHSLDNILLPSVTQSRSLIPPLPPSRQTLAPLNLPGHLPQQAPPARIIQSLNTSASSEVTQDDTEWAFPRPTLAQPVLPPIHSSRTNQPASLPRYDQVHGNVPTRGQPQLPSYTASPTPEPPTSNADEDQSGVSSLEEIHVAAMDGVKSATMKKLALRYGVDYRDHGGRTPLMYAVLGNQPKMCELLIQLGADVNATDYSSLSPLLWSAYHLRPIPMRILLRHDANSSFCDSDGRSAFHWSCKSPDTKCLKLLCKFAKEGVVDKVDSEGLSALHWAVMCDNDTHIRLLLSSSDANVYVTDREGRTALNYAVLNYSPHCIKAILDNQETIVNHVDTKGRTVLHYCCAEGSVDCVRALISYKSCDVNAQDNDGTTPMHWAAAANQAGVLQYLLRHGADRTLLDNQGMSALDHAQQREYQQCVTILESYGLKRQLSVFSIASQASLPVHPPRPVDQHGHIIPKRPGRRFSLSPDSMASSTSSLHRPPGDGHSHPDGAGDTRTPVAITNQQSAATSSSTQCGAETSSVVPWQGGSTISVNGDEPVPAQRGSFLSRLMSTLSCGLGSCGRSNAIAPAELTTAQSN